MTDTQLQTLDDVDFYVIVWGLADLHAATFNAFRQAVDELGMPYQIVDMDASFEEGIIPIALAPFTSQAKMHAWLASLPAAATGKIPFDELPIAVVRSRKSTSNYLMEGDFSVSRAKAVLTLIADIKKQATKIVYR